MRIAVMGEEKGVAEATRRAAEERGLGVLDPNTFAISHRHHVPRDLVLVDRDWHSAITLCLHTGEWSWLYEWVGVMVSMTILGRVRIRNGRDHARTVSSRGTSSSSACALYWSSGLRSCRNRGQVLLVLLVFLIATSCPSMTSPRRR